jgi:uncharacterized protein (DUF1800 family)
MSRLAPLPPEQFDPYAASRLLWRAGFGGTWDEAEQLSAVGLDNAVNALVNYPPLPIGEPPEIARLPKETDHDFQLRVRDLDPDERNTARNLRNQTERQKIDNLKFWWLSRMLHATPGSDTLRPLEEKLTLFWHSHFASSYEDKIERTFPLWQQNELFRRNALAPFPVLLGKVIRDPAMLVWLDNWQSHKGNPNENFARELMELFSTGVNQYTEDDVKAAARALTGFSVDRDTWEFRFNADAHDEGDKTYFGKTGNWSGDAVVRLICEQPATARFLAGKLVSHFVYEDPEPEVLDEVSDLYRSSGYDTRKLLNVLFRSQLFYS